MSLFLLEQVWRWHLQFCPEKATLRQWIEFSINFLSREDVGRKRKMWCLALQTPYLATFILGLCTITLEKKSAVICLCVSNYGETLSNGASLFWRTPMYVCVSVCVCVRLSVRFLPCQHKYKSLALLSKQKQRGQHMVNGFVVFSSHFYVYLGSRFGWIRHSHNWLDTWWILVAESLIDHLKSPLGGFFHRFHRSNKSPKVSFRVFHHAQEKN